jgi:hypothetical protein
MIIHIDRVRPSWMRRIAVVSMCAGSTAALVVLLDAPVPPTPEVARPRPGFGPVVAAVKREPASPAVPGALAEARTPSAAPVRVTEPARAVGAQSVVPPSQPFKFLGKVTAEGETSVVLYGRGRTLTVRATGPIDDDYTVDAIEEDHLVLRQVRGGATEILPLTTRQRAPVEPVSAAATPED